MILAESADIFIVVGTSLSVYPAAGLLDVTPAKRKILVDPKPNLRGRPGFEVIAEPATIGVPRVVRDLLTSASS